jgi:hypothetical protein
LEVKSKNKLTHLLKTLPNNLRKRENNRKALLMRKISKKTSEKTKDLLATLFPSLSTSLS